MRIRRERNRWERIQRTFLDTLSFLIILSILIGGWVIGAKIVSFGVSLLTKERNLHDIIVHAAELATDITFLSIMAVAVYVAVKEAWQQLRGE